MSREVARERLESVIDLGGISSVYQAIVDLATGRTVGYEALARGPQGSDLERPDQLFEHAARLGLLADLDWACRTAALQGAAEAGLAAPMTLFVNVEPAAFGTAPTARFTDLAARLGGDLPIVVEFTERSLARDPARLLAAADWVREQGWGVALDDIGAEPASLALMPFLSPDVLKLDLRLVQQRTDAEVAGVIAAVNAQAERTGALVLAEGIETPEHEQLARAMGARLAQGWLYGRPHPQHQLPPSAAAGAALPRLELRPSAQWNRTTSPFDLAARAGRVQRSTKPLLIAMSKHLEQQALGLTGGAVVLGAFQTADRFTPHTRVRYEELDRVAELVVILGTGMPPNPLGDVVGAALHPADPLTGEWDVAVVGPHFAGALLAKDLGDDGPDHQRRFDYVVTYDRDTVLAAATSLLRRVTQSEHGTQDAADQRPAEPLLAGVPH